LRHQTQAVVVGTLLCALLLLSCSWRTPRPLDTPTRAATAPPARPTWTSVPAPTDTLVPRPTGTPSQPAASPTPTLTPLVKRGYGLHVKGVNYKDDSLQKAVALGVEWIKIYDHPPPERLPFKVLYRVNLPRPDEDWAEWGHYRYLDAELYAGRIDAYEIGNEPNLIEEWGRPPDPAAYAELLEIAYREIKSADPNALVVSAGLASVGSSDDPHHLNDIAFLGEMYAHGAARYFDVLGTHPFGFAYPPQISPDGQMCSTDVDARGPVLDLGCRSVAGLCFRRVERLREVMVAYGDEDKPVWATEFGWIIRPPPCCRGQSDWPARYWQVVSEETQARYILHAFTYARRYWPWMEAMFLWNLDFSRYTPGSDETCPSCETMGWYSILNPDGSPRLAYSWLAKNGGCGLWAE